MGEKPVKYAKAMAIYSSLLVALPAGVFGGFLLGRWLDRYLGTGPLITIIGLLLGAVVGFHQMYRIVTRAL